MTSARDMKQLVRRYEGAGFTVRPTSRGHNQFLLDGRIVAVSGSTPGDHRGLKNLEALLKQALREKQGEQVPKATEEPRGRDKLIAERQQLKLRNHDRIRQVLEQAKEPLTVHEIALRVGLNPATVADAAKELGLHRRKAQHSERGATLMGANPYLYWTDRKVPSRRNPIEGTASSNGTRSGARVREDTTMPGTQTQAAKQAMTTPAPEPAQKTGEVMEQVAGLPDGRILLTDTSGGLWVAVKVPV